MICGAPDCGAELGHRNRSGFCADHYYLSPVAQEKRRESYSEKRDHHNRKRREWISRNRDRHLEASRKWRAANRDKAWEYDLRKYGIGGEEYEKLLQAQGGVCAVCLSGPTMKRKRLSVDHCHNTGVVRGLLCNNCNFVLGFARDRIGVLQRAIEYLTNQQLDDAAKDRNGEGAE